MTEMARNWLQDERGKVIKRGHTNLYWVTVLTTLATVVAAVAGWMVFWPR